jgi:MoaA/NifB/PqqE/SkfB family radical SAM enzyme
MLTNENASSIEGILNYFSNHFNYDRQALNLLRRPASTSEEPGLIGIKKYFDLVQTINKKLMRATPTLKQKLNHIFLEYCHEKSIREFNLRKSLDTCLAARKFFAMNNGGDIFPCEILLEPLGNIRNEGYEFNKIIQSERARDIQMKIRNRRCYCQWPCAVVNNTLFNGKSYFKLLKRMIFAQGNQMAQYYSYNDS